MADVVEKKCVVCGMGSTRADWQSKDNPACDGHSPSEIQAALAGKKGNGGAKTPPPAPPAASTK